MKVILEIRPTRQLVGRCRNCCTFFECDLSDTYASWGEDATDCPRCGKEVFLLLPENDISAEEPGK